MFGTGCGCLCFLDVGLLGEFVRSLLIDKPRDDLVVGVLFQCLPQTTTSDLDSSWDLEKRVHAQIDSTNI